MRSAIAPLLLMVAACAAPRVTALPPCASAGEQRMQSADERLSICLPPDFAAAGTSGHAWARGTATDSGYVFVTAAVLDSTELQSLDGWPPRLSAEAHGVVHELVCESIDRTSLPSGSDSIVVESGICTGGVAGWRRQPVALGGWRAGQSSYVFYQAFAYRSEDRPLLVATPASIIVR